MKRFFSLVAALVVGGLLSAQEYGLFSARDAIRLMGALAEQYGYGDSGECLTVADKNEVWQFEIVGVGKDRIGAAWVAKRVPDDHVAVSANIPRIGRIDRRSQDMMASANVEKVALDNGLWDGRGEFIFWKYFNTDYAKGKNFNEEILRLENLALDGAPAGPVSTPALNAYTEYIYQESVRRWKALEDKYWVQFGTGF